MFDDDFRKYSNFCDTRIIKNLKYKKDEKRFLKSLLNKF